MSLKFDEASIDRPRRPFSRRGNFCPPMATPPATVRVHHSQVFIGVRSTFQPVRVRACGGALRNPNQPRFIGRQPEARVYTEPPKGEWQRRVFLSRPPIDKIPSPSPVLIARISSVPRRSQISIEIHPTPDRARRWEPRVDFRRFGRGPNASRVRIVLTRLCQTFQRVEFTGWLVETRANPSLNLFAVT